MGVQLEDDLAGLAVELTKTLPGGEGEYEGQATPARAGQEGDGDKAVSSFLKGMVTCSLDDRKRCIGLLCRLLPELKGCEISENGVLLVSVVVLRVAMDQDCALTGQFLECVKLGMGFIVGNLEIISQNNPQYFNKLVHVLGALLGESCGDEYCLHLYEEVQADSFKVVFGCSRESSLFLEDNIWSKLARRSSGCGHDEAKPGIRQRNSICLAMKKGFILNFQSQYLVQCLELCNKILISMDENEPGEQKTQDLPLYALALFQNVGPVVNKTRKLARFYIRLVSTKSLLWLVSGTALPGSTSELMEVTLMNMVSVCIRLSSDSSMHSKTLQVGLRYLPQKSKGLALCFPSVDNYSELPYGISAALVLRMAKIASGVSKAYLSVRDVLEKILPFWVDVSAVTRTFLPIVYSSLELLCSWIRLLGPGHVETLSASGWVTGTIKWMHLCTELVDLKSTNATCKKWLNACIKLSTELLNTVFSNWELSKSIYSQIDFDLLMQLLDKSDCIFAAMENGILGDEKEWELLRDISGSSLNMSSVFPLTLEESNLNIVLAILRGRQTSFRMEQRGEVEDPLFVIVFSNIVSSLEKDMLLNYRYVILLLEIFSTCSHSTKLELFQSIIQLVVSLDARTNTKFCSELVILIERLLCGWLFDYTKTEKIKLCDYYTDEYRAFLDSDESFKDLNAKPPLEIVFDTCDLPVDNFANLAAWLLRNTRHMFDAVSQDNGKFQWALFCTVSFRVLTMFQSVNSVELLGCVDTVDSLMNTGAIVSLMHYILACFKSGRHEDGVYQLSLILDRLPLWMEQEKNWQQVGAVSDAVVNTLISCVTTYHSWLGKYTEGIATFLVRSLEFWRSKVEKVYAVALADIFLHTTSPSAEKRSRLEALLEVNTDHSPNMYNILVRFSGTGDPLLIMTQLQEKLKNLTPLKPYNKACSDWDTIDLDAIVRCLPLESEFAEIVSHEESIVTVLEICSHFIDRFGLQNRLDLQQVIVAIYFGSPSERVRTHASRLAKPLRIDVTTSPIVAVVRFTSNCRFLGRVVDFLTTVENAELKKFVVSIVAMLLNRLNGDKDSVKVNPFDEESRNVSDATSVITKLMAVKAISKTTLNTSIVLLSNILDGASNKCKLVLDDTFWDRFIREIYFELDVERDALKDILSRMLKMSVETESKPFVNIIVGKLDPKFLLQHSNILIGMLPLMSNAGVDLADMLTCCTSIVQYIVDVETCSNELMLAYSKVIRACMTCIQGYLAVNEVVPSVGKRPSTDNSTSTEPKGKSAKTESEPDVVNEKTTSSKILESDSSENDCQTFEFGENQNFENENGSSGRISEDEGIAVDVGEENWERPTEEDDSFFHRLVKRRLDGSCHKNSTLMEIDEEQKVKESSPRILGTGQLGYGEHTEDDEFLDSEGQSSSKAQKRRRGIGEIAKSLIDIGLKSDSRTSSKRRGKRESRNSESKTKASSRTTETKKGKGNSKNVCTYTLTGKTYDDQHWYHCLTCKLVKEKGCCSVCAKHCHQGHEIMYARRSRFFCDCGAESSCTSQTPRPVGDKFHEPSMFLPASRARLIEENSPLVQQFDDKTRFIVDTDKLEKLNTFSFYETARAVLEWLFKRKDMLETKTDESHRDVSSAPCFEVKCATVDGVFSMFKAPGTSTKKILYCMRKVMAVNSNGHLFIAEGTTVRCLHAGALLCDGARNADGQLYDYKNKTNVRESALKTLYRMSLSFTVMQVEFNPCRDHYVAIVGDTNCFVLTLSEKGGVLSKFRVELALQMTKMDYGDDKDLETTVIGVSWLHGSQTHLMVVTTSWIKVFSLSTDSTYPVHFYEFESRIANFTLAKVKYAGGLVTNHIFVLLESGILVHQETSESTGTKACNIVHWGANQMPEGSVKSMHAVLESGVNPVVVLSYDNGNTMVLTLQFCQGGIEVIRCEAVKCESGDVSLQWVEWGISSGSHRLLGLSETAPRFACYSGIGGNQPVQVGFETWANNSSKVTRNAVAMCIWPPAWTPLPSYQNLELDSEAAYFRSIPSPSCAMERRSVLGKFPFLRTEQNVLLVLCSNGQLMRLVPKNEVFAKDVACIEGAGKEVVSQIPVKTKGHHLRCPAPFLFEHALAVSSNGLLNSCFSWGGSVLLSVPTAQRAGSMLQIGRSESHISSKSPHSNFVLTAHLSCPGYALVALRVYVGSQSDTCIPKAALVGPLKRKITIPQHSSRWLDLTLSPTEVLLTQARGGVLEVTLTPSSSSGSDGIWLDAAEAYAMETSSKMWADFMRPAWDYAFRKLEDKKNHVQHPVDGTHMNLEASVGSALDATMTCLSTTMDAAKSLSVNLNHDDHENTALIASLERQIASDRVFRNKKITPRSRLLQTMLNMKQEPFWQRMNRACLDVVVDLVGEHSEGRSAFAQFLDACSFLGETINATDEAYWDWLSTNRIKKLFRALAEAYNSEVSKLLAGQLSADMLFLLEKANASFFNLLFSYSFIEWSKSSEQAVFEVFKEIFTEFVSGDIVSVFFVDHTMHHFISLYLDPKDANPSSAGSKLKGAEQKGRDNSLVEGESILYRCDGCEVFPMKGSRWHCTSCEDFDLCDKCNGKSFGDHKSSHAMVAFPTGTPQATPVPPTGQGAKKTQFAEKLVLELGDFCLKLVSNADPRNEILYMCVVKTLMHLAPKLKKIGTLLVEKICEEISIVVQLTDAERKARLVDSTSGMYFLVLLTALRVISYNGEGPGRTSKPSTVSKGQVSPMLRESLKTLLDENDRRRVSEQLLRLMVLLLKLPEESYSSKSHSVISSSTESSSKKDSGNTNGQKLLSESITSYLLDYSIGATVAFWAPFLKSADVIAASDRMEFQKSLSLPKYLLKVTLNLLHSMLNSSYVTERDSLVHSLIGMVQDPHFKFVHRRGSDILSIICEGHSDFRWLRNLDSFQKAIASIHEVGQKLSTNSSTRGLQCYHLGILPSFLPHGVTFQDLVTVTNVVKQLNRLVGDAQTDWLRYCCMPEEQDDKKYHALAVLLAAFPLFPNQCAINVLGLLVRGLPAPDTNGSMVTDGFRLHLANTLEDGTVLNVLSTLMLSNHNSQIRLVAVTIWRRLICCVNSPDETCKKVRNMMIMFLVSRFTRVLVSSEYGSELIMLITSLIQQPEFDDCEQSIYETIVNHACKILASCNDMLDSHKDAIRNRQLGKFVHFDRSNQQAGDAKETSSSVSTIVLPPYSGTNSSIGVCLSCNVPRRTYKPMQLKHAKSETKYTANTMLVSLDCMFTVESIQVEIQPLTVISGGGINAVNVYCNSTPTSELGSLKDKWQAWHKIATIKTGKDASTRSVARLPVPVSICNLMFEYETTAELAFSQNSERQICPRCNRMVSDRGGVCQCGEIVFQCRQCRRINQEDRNAFLCVECGYCRYAKFTFTLVARVSTDYPPILSEGDKEHAFKYFESFEDTAHSLELTLESMFEPARETANSLWREMGYSGYSTLIQARDSSEESPASSFSAKKLSLYSSPKLQRKSSSKEQNDKKHVSIEFLQKLGLIQEYQPYYRMDNSNSSSSGTTKAATSSSSASSGKQEKAQPFEVDEKASSLIQSLTLSLGKLDDIETNIKSSDGKRRRLVDSARLEHTSSKKTTDDKGKSKLKNGGSSKKSSHNSSRKGGDSVFGSFPSFKSLHINNHLANVPLTYTKDTSKALYDKLVITRHAMDNIHKEFVAYENRCAQSVVLRQLPADTGRPEKEGERVLQIAEKELTKLKTTDQDKCATCAEEFAILSCKLIGTLSAKGACASYLEACDVVSLLMSRGVSLSKNGCLGPSGEALLAFAQISNSSTQLILEASGKRLDECFEQAHTLNHGEWIGGIMMLLDRMSDKNASESSKQTIMFILRFLANQTDKIGPENRTWLKTEVVQAVILPMLRIVGRVCEQEEYKKQISDEVIASIAIWKPVAYETSPPIDKDLAWVPYVSRNAAKIIQSFYKSYVKGQSLPKKKGCSSVPISQDSVLLGRWDWMWTFLMHPTSATVRSEVVTIINSLASIKSPLTTSATTSQRKKRKHRKSAGTSVKSSVSSNTIHIGLLDALTYVASILYRSVGVNSVVVKEFFNVYSSIVTMCDVRVFKLLTFRGIARFISRIINNEAHRLGEVEESMLRLGDHDDWVQVEEENEFVWLHEVVAVLNMFVSTPAICANVSRYSQADLLEAYVRVNCFSLLHGSTITQTVEMLHSLLSSVSCSPYSATNDTKKKEKMTPAYQKADEFEELSYTVSGSLLSSFVERIVSHTNAGDTTKQYSDLKLVTCLIEEITGLIDPVETLPNIFILMHRARTQEEYFTGNLETNPISIDDVPLDEGEGIETSQDDSRSGASVGEAEGSANTGGGGSPAATQNGRWTTGNPALRTFSETLGENTGGGGKVDSEREPTMRDLRAKIACDLNFKHAKDIMELLVADKIINPDLPIRLVYEKIWKPHYLRDEGVDDQRRHQRSESHMSMEDEDDDKHDDDLIDHDAMYEHDHDEIMKGSDDDLDDENPLGIVKLGSRKTHFTLEEDEEDDGEDDHMVFTFGEDGVRASYGNDEMGEEMRDGGQFPPMEVTYRLCGIDGEAEEDFVETLSSDDSNKGGTEEIPEVKYACTVPFAKNGGIKSLLTVVDVLSTGFTISSSAVRNGLAVTIGLLSLCANVPENRKTMHELGVMPKLLAALMGSFQEVSAAPQAEQLVYILETLVGDPPETLAEEVESAALTNKKAGTAKSELAVFLEHLDAQDRATALRDSPRLLRAMARLLPFLTFGRASDVALLLDRFKQHLGPERLNCLDSDGTNKWDEQKQFHADSILWSIDALGMDKNSMALRDAAVEAGYISSLAGYFCKGWKLSLGGDEENKQEASEIKKAALELAKLPSTLIILRMLTGFCKNHAGIQTSLVTSGVLEIAFHLEQIPSENVSMVGEFADNFLQTVTGGEDARLALAKMRKEWNDMKQKKAMSKREAMLNKMGLQNTQKKKKRKSSVVEEGEGEGDDSTKKRKKKKKKKKEKPSGQPEWMKQMNDLVDEQGPVCTVCREGYVYKPTELLGVYVYSKSIVIPDTVTFVNKSNAIFPQLHTFEKLDVEKKDVCINQTFEKDLIKFRPGVYKKWSTSKWSPTTAGTSLDSSGSGTKASDSAPSTASSLLLTGDSGSSSGLTFPRRKSWGITTVSCFNCIHFSCHAKAVRADKHHAKAPKEEWEGAELRNAQTKCNNLLPLRGPNTITDARYSLAADKYFEIQGNRSRGLTLSTSSSTPNALSLVLLDLRVLLLRFAYAESLSEDTRGGGRESNFKLIVPAIALARYLMNNDSPTLKNQLTELHDHFLLVSIMLIESEKGTSWDRVKNVDSPAPETQAEDANKLPPKGEKMSERKRRSSSLTEKRKKQAKPCFLPDFVLCSLITILIGYSENEWQAMQMAFLRGVVEASLEISKGTATPESGALKTKQQNRPKSFELYKPQLIVLGIINMLHKHIGVAGGLEAWLQEEASSIEGMDEIRKSYESKLLEACTASELLSEIGVTNESTRKWFLERIN